MTDDAPTDDDPMRARERVLRRALLDGLDGDAQAYHTFLRDLAPVLRAFLRKRTAAMPDDVEDLVQETLIAIHVQRHTYRPDLPVTAWALAIARYKLVDRLRARRLRDARHVPLDDEPGVAAPDVLAACTARRDLSLLLDRLPAHHRIPIEHTRLQGLSVDEASRATGMSASAIKVGVHRGLKALARMIAPRGPSGSANPSPPDVADASGARRR